MNKSPPNLRNLRRESIFKPYAEEIFSKKLGKHEFENFYVQLTDTQKDLFLGATARYVFLVRDGDWHVTRDDSNPIIDYLTNSFKLVSLFSLIESLSPEKHEDFYEWLKKCDDVVFPLTDKAKLETLYQEYKETYGAIRRCVKFFERLPLQRQNELLSGFKIKGEAASEIKKVAEFLYSLRSKFVHEGEFVLDIANTPVISRHKGKITITKISMACLLQAFEDGLLAYFFAEIAA